MKQLSGRTNEDIRNKIDKVDQKNRNTHQLHTILEHKCAELVKLVTKIKGHHEIIQRERNHVKVIKCDKFVQTEVVKIESSRDLAVKNLKEFEYEKELLPAFKSSGAIQTEKLENLWQKEVLVDGHDLDLKFRGKNGY